MALLKKICFCGFAAAALAASAGCGAQGGDGISASAGAENESVISAKEILSAMEYDPAHYVELGDCSHIEAEMYLEIYEITDEDVEACAKEDLSSYGSALSYASLDDAAVMEYICPETGCGTVSEYLGMLRDELEDAAKTRYQEDLKEAVLEWLLDHCTAALPDKAAGKRAGIYMERLRDGLEDGGMEAYLKERGYGSEEELSEALEAYAEDELKKELILAAVIRDAGFTVTREGFGAFVSSYAAELSMDEESLKEYYGGEDRLLLYYAENQALESLCQSASVTDLSDGMALDAGQ